MPRQKSRKERNKILKFSTKRNSEDVIGNIDVTVFKISSAYNTFIFLSIAFKCIYCLEVGITKQGCIYIKNTVRGQDFFYGFKTLDNISKQNGCIFEIIT